jgi:hypothetical protein
VSDFCLGVALASWNAKRSPPPVAPTSGAFVSLSHIDRAGLRRIAVDTVIAVNGFFD